jgi:hypothetical protein
MINNPHRILLGLGLALFFTACSSLDTQVPAPPSNPLPNPPSGKIISYQSSSENFLNPERGFYLSVPITQETDLSWVKPQHRVTVVHSYVRLDAYRTSLVPQSYIAQVTRGLEAARRAGLKVVLRFAYNFGFEADAPLEWVLRHIEQFQPVLRDYKDVILVLQAGFIGAWGEWHASTNGLTSLTNKRTILNALLTATPSDRMVQLRYPGDLMALYPTPLDSNTGFSGSNQARVGHHNDCFLSGPDDTGTYHPIGQKSAMQSYLERMSEFTGVGGETCQVNSGQQRTDCPTALAEMRRFRWSYLNLTFYRPAIDRWRAEGCFDEIARKLGYRFRLVRAVVPEQVGRSGRLQMSLEIANDGFATPFNPRPVQLVLRARGTQAVYTVAVSSDPRRWRAGQTTTIGIDVALPTSLPAGEYDLLLHLPDAASGLSSRPEYAIRLANQNTWEASTGYNNLQTTLKVQ